jgi:hypothetical protein
MSSFASKSDFKIQVRALHFVLGTEMRADQPGFWYSRCRTAQERLAYATYTVALVISSSSLRAWNLPANPEKPSSPWKQLGAITCGMRLDLGASCF